MWIRRIRTCTYILYTIHTYLGPPRDLCYYVFDDEVKTLSVAGGVVVKLDRTVSWPSLGRTITLNNGRGLAQGRAIITNSLLVERGLLHWLHVSIGYPVKFPTF